MAVSNFLGIHGEWFADDFDVPVLATPPPAGLRSVSRNAIPVGEAGSATSPTRMRLVTGGYREDVRVSPASNALVTPFAVLTDQSSGCVRSFRKVL